jgi:hypothetical protein
MAQERIHLAHDEIYMAQDRIHMTQHRMHWLSIGSIWLKTNMILGASVFIFVFHKRRGISQQASQDVLCSKNYLYFEVNAGSKVVTFSYDASPLFILIPLLS